ncbi:hypothetical protein W97_05127 [Coniosporium apollinis CBS 100218]|uniref:Uncharacterized protein n=1 Tax=Coniosporium apollinis (strain CBS 100218) TaxID=1168221 RepID=R7YVC3_CONA1|nr:uncharacterized protein W97_05127 [Coniosporium apollinis CBS 100218]EON65885.1 hypothetical protein W97_05127 [Coniosporium apollinis CBS 100218]
MLRWLADNRSGDWEQGNGLDKHISGEQQAEVAGKISSKRWQLDTPVSWTRPVSHSFSSQHSTSEPVVRNAQLLKSTVALKRSQGVSARVLRPAARKTRNAASTDCLRSYHHDQSRSRSAIDLDAGRMEDYR